jgi:hypothetical protein
MGDAKTTREVLVYAPPNLQAVKGHPMRIFRTFALPMLLLEVPVMLPIWFLHYSIRFKILLMVLFIVFFAIATALVMLITAFARAEIVNEQVVFISFGIRTRKISLAAIRAYKPVFPRRPNSAICILYGSSSTYVPNGALDPKELVNLLHAHGVPEQLLRPLTWR